jgi:hypothetical protein
MTNYKLKKEFLHDAATSMGIDPHSEQELANGEYALLFESSKTAAKVAMLAAKNIRRETLIDASAEISPVGRLHSATLIFLQ